MLSSFNAIIMSLTQDVSPGISKITKRTPSWRYH